MNDGFILLHRKILDNQLWPKNRAFTKIEAWIDLLLMARYDHKPAEILIGKEMLICERGQIIRSINTYQKRWNWGAQRVKSFFDILLKLKQIEKKTTTKTTILTICNYDSYQGQQQTKNKPKINQKQTKNKPITINKQREQSKQGKQINNMSVEIKNFTASLSKSFPENITSKLTDVEKWNWIDTVDKLIRIDKFTTSEIKKAVSAGRNSEFWNKQFLSITKLRKKNKDEIKYINVFLNLNGHVSAQSILKEIKR